MRTRVPTLALCFASLAFAAAGCVSDEDVEDGENDSFGGKADSLVEGTAEARAVLALVNDTRVDVEELDIDAGLSSRVAKNIVKHRDGVDRAPGTSDDDLYDTLAELDAVPYLGSAALRQLLAYAREKGLLRPTPHVEVIFSPQPAASTHAARVAGMIRGAHHTVDIAMYSFSDAGIQAALVDAVGRGVEVRFLFDTASEDRKILDLVARTATKSGKLEKAGVDVRWVNKILHHKFILVDGPRDDASRAATAKLSTGSANWSNGGATIYDENTLFIDNSAELNTAYQKEFDLLWSHSKDFVLAAALPYELSTANLGDGGDDRGIAAYFTSPNFNVNGTTFSVDWQRTKMSDVLVAAIGRAQDSIIVAEGHMRLRAVAEALLAAKQAHPAIDVRVYLDQQEYISITGDNQQRSELAACLATAGTDARKVFDCKSKAFLFAKALVDGGIDVRFKSFAYRWDASYAVQMHSKYILVDGKDLYTGSYNLSMNSEQATFENVVHLTSAEYPAVISAFQRNFDTMRETGRAEGLLAQLRQTVQTAATIPMVFPPMALTYQEFGDLRALIRANCATADSTDFRENPGAHRTCAR